MIAKSRLLIALLVAAVFFMENLDATIITTAIPYMAKDFQTEPTYLSIGLSSYLVALTVLIPVSGWATDRFGARLIFPMAIIIFTLASILCACSQNLTWFTLARVLQGVGGAMMVPVGRLVVLRDTPKSEMVNVIAVLTWPALTAPLLGPVLGGWISMHWSWHWIFLINVPLGLLALIAALYLIRVEARKVGSFDWVGCLLSGLGFSLFMIGVELASRNDVSVLWTIVVLAMGLIMLIWTIKHMLKVSNPLFSLLPLKHQTFRLTLLSGSLFRIAIASIPFILPLMFQLGFGWSAVKAGSMLLWLFAGNLFMKPFTTSLMRYFGFRNILFTNGLLLGIGFWIMGFFTADLSTTWLAILLFIAGMTRSVQFTALNSIAFSDVNNQEMRDATTLFSVVLQMNTGMGISMGALAIALSTWLYQHFGQLIVHVGIYQLACWFMSLLIFCGLIECWLLPKQAGAALLSSHQKNK